MTKNYRKTKDTSKDPNATGPKYRTPDFYKGKVFAGVKQAPKKFFNSAQFPI